MNLKLIDEIRTAWKLNSVWIPALLAAITALSVFLPQITAMVPAKWVPWIVFFFAVATILGRLFKQPATVIDGNELKLVALANKLQELAKQYQDAIKNPDNEAWKILNSLNELKAEYDKLMATTMSKAEAEGVPLKMMSNNP